MDPREFPTKGNLMLAKNSLALANQGYELMDKKRNILLKELMGLIDEAKGIQEEIDSTFTQAYVCLQRANIEMGISRVQEFAFTVPIEDSIRIQTRSIMGTEIPHLPRHMRACSALILRWESAGYRNLHSLYQLKIPFVYRPEVLWEQRFHISNMMKSRMT